MAGPYVYVEDIPQSTDKIRNSQPDLLQNTNSVKGIFEENHVAFSSTDAGKHKFLQMPEQTGNPTIAVNEAGLFVKEGTFSAEAELNFRRENNGQVIPFTEASLSQPGWSRLPSGLIMKWDRQTISALDASANFIAIVFPAGPAFSTVYTVNVQIQADPANPARDLNIATYVYGVTTTGFNVRQWRRNSSGTAGTDKGPYVINYLAIGS